MAVRTFRVAVGNDGNFGALSEIDETAANRTDGWTSAKIAAANYANFDAGTKQASTSFGGTVAPTALLTGATANAFIEGPFTGTFANSNWVFTFALRCTVASAQRGAMNLGIYKSPNADGSGATRLTSSTPVTGTTVAAALSTTADQTSVCTWTPGGPVTLNNEYLFFAVAWGITTAGGSNTADVVIRTGQAAGGSRMVTPDFIGSQNVTAGGLGSAQSFGSPTVAIYVPEVYRTLVLSRSPKAYWRFGSSPLVDESGNGNTLTVVGTAPVAAASLLSSDPDGSRDFSAGGYTAASSSSLTLSPPYSFEVWFNGDNYPGGYDADLITKPNSFIVRANSGPVGNLHFYYYDGSWRGPYGTAAAFTVGQRYHVVCIDDGSTIRCYVNGVEVQNTGRASGGMNAPADITVIGGYWTGSLVDQFDGRIDEAVVYGTALSFFDVRRSYLSGIAVAGASVSVGSVASAAALGAVTPKATVTRPVTGLGSAQSFGTVTFRTAVTRAVPGVGSAQVFGGETFPQKVTVQGIQRGSVTGSIVGGFIVGDGHLVGQASSGDVLFGVPVAKVIQTLQPVGIPTAQLFGTVTIVKGPVARQVTGLGSAQLFGTVTIVKGPVTRQMFGIGSPQDFGTVTFRLTKASGGVASAQAFGTPVLASLAFPQTKTVNGVVSAQSFGSVTLTSGASFPQTKTVTGLGSAQTFGALTIKGAFTRTVAGVGSAQAFGSLAFRVKVGSGGVLSAQAFGVPVVQLKGPPQTVQVQGIGDPPVVITIVGQFLVGQRLVGWTGSKFGHPAVFVAQVVSAVNGVPSAQQFGVFVPKRSFTVAGVPTAQRFGAVTPNSLFPVAGVPSAQLFGSVHLMYPQWIPVQGVPSAALFGRPKVVRSLTPVSCSGLPSDSVTCTGLPSVAGGCENLTVTTPATPGLVLVPGHVEDLTLTEA